MNKPDCFSQFEQSEAFFMRATGIVRRIDELGRVVIPKEELGRAGHAPASIPSAPPTSLFSEAVGEGG